MIRLLDLTKKILSTSIKLILGNCIIQPLSCLTPKKKIVVFITRFGNTFEGNLKYLFLYLNSRNDLGDTKFYFLTESKKIREELQTAGLPVLYYYRLSTFLILLRSQAVVVDGNEWAGKLRHQLLIRTAKFQLWHGSGMKTVGKLKPRLQKQSPLIKKISDIVGLHPCYDILSMNSQVQVETRAHAFNYKKILINGQPRNDVLFVEDSEPYLAGADVETFHKAVDYKKQGYKLVIYSPTHRHPSKEYDVVKGAMDIAELNRFAEQHKIVFIFKYHQKTRKEHQYDISSADNMIEYNKYKDVYPLFAYIDLMITDYSSIFVDFMVLGRPVVFFPFDYNHYVNTE
uniref:CDP-glycerol glycerophosphotransferase family protein n=1 Tax=Oceanispirochaeta sp. TaxID=2035350 RepID=UPI00262774CF